MRRITSILLALMMIVSSFAGFGIISFADTSNDESALLSESNSDGEIVALSAGENVTAVVRADGSLWTWGADDYNNTTYQQIILGQKDGCVVKGTPQMVSCKNVKSISYNDSYVSERGNQILSNCGVIDADGNLWFWGNEIYGYSSNSYTYLSYKTISLPEKVDGLSNVVQFASSGYHYAAVTDDGSLYMWGMNYYGQLGIGEANYSGKSEPYKIMDNVESVALADNITVILKKDGTVWTCGFNYGGVLGINQKYSDLKFSATPVQVEGLSNVKKIAVGSAGQTAFAGAVTNDGSLYTWGSNDVGQLGVGSEADSSTPIINTTVTDAKDIDFGPDFAGALTNDGKLYMWGNGERYKLGTGNTSTANVPTCIMTDIALFSLGAYHSVAVCNDNTLYTWGYNNAGQLGNHLVDGTMNGFVQCPTKITLGSTTVNYTMMDDVSENDKNMDIMWDDAYLYDDPSVYNKNLAIDSLILSSEFGSTSDSTFGKAMKSLGFKYVDGKESREISSPGYVIGYRTLNNFGSNTVEIVMSIMGTDILSEDSLTDLKSTKDGFTAAGESCYKALMEAKSDITSEISKNGMTLTKSNTRYLITGHSLGAACANLVCLKLIKQDLAMPTKLFGYAYATPNYAYNISENNSVPGLYNFISSFDIVPYVPPVSMISALGFGMHTGHAGHVYTSWNANAIDAKFNKTIKDLYGEIPWDMYMTIKMHTTPTYYSLIVNDEMQEGITSFLSRLLSVHCPVDVEVYDNEGNIVAHTNGESIVYDDSYTPITIAISGDDKYISIPDNDENYTVKYIGTDTGTMDIEDQIINTETEEIVAEKDFKNVALDEGKTFTSEVVASQEEVSTKLFVTDESGDKISKVNTDGTESPYKVDSITLKTLPDETTYIEGEKFDKNGLVVEANYSDGTSQIIDDYVLYNTGTNKIGNRTVTVYYKGAAETFEITVLEKSLTDITVKLPNKTVYITGEEFDTTGMVVTANYNNGKSEEVTNYDISGFGESEEFNVITITYEGKKKSFIVRIHTPENEWTETKAATCSEPGENSLYCSVCGEVIKTEKIVVGHSYGEWEEVTSPKCEDKGSKQRVCSECGHIETAEIDAKGHDWKENYTIDKKATCTEDGSKSIHCKNCDAVKDSTVIKATGHDEKTTLIKATVDAAGSRKTVCKTCNEIVEDVVINKIESIELVKDEYVYDGKEKKPELIILDAANHRLTEGTDYTVEYKNNDEVGTAKAIVTFEGNYDGVAIEKFTIKQGIPDYSIPTGLKATYGDKLYSVALPDGFTWVDGTQSVGNAGTNTFKAKYTPEDTSNYVTVKDIDIQVEVAKATVKAGAIDTLEATCNETLSQIALPDGYSWNDGTRSVGTASSNVKYFKATFKAADTANYNDNTDVTVGIRVKHSDSKTEITKKASTAEAGTIRTYCEACNETLKEEAIPQIAIHELAKTSVKFDGEEQTPAVTIKDSEGNVLAEGKDYELAYANNTNVGTASVTITYEGRYTGEETLNFEITKSAGAEIALSKDEYTYDGTQKKPAVTVKSGNKTLTAGDDYTVEYSDNVGAGTAKATVTLTGNYEGTIEKSFLIVPADNGKVTVSLDKATAVYTGGEIKPAVTVTGIGSETLTEGEDYALTYSDNVNVGTAYAKVTLLKNYAGAVTQTYKITAADGSGLSMALSDTEYIYSGKALKPHPIITGLDGRELTKGKDFTVDYSNNTDAGTATATVSFIGNYSGTKTKTFSILQADGTALSLQLSDNEYVYDGSAKTPHPVITGIDGKELTKGTDFDVSYSDNTNAGTATAAITFKGNYSGFAQKTFTIKALSVGVELLQTSFKYKGSAIEPEFEIQASAGLTPVEGTDYTVSYTNNDTYGTGHVVVTFSGNYSGTIDKEFEIIRTYNLEGSVAGCSSGKEVEVAITDESGTETKVTTTDGKYSFKWLDGGNYTISVKGTGDYITREYTKLLDNDYLSESFEIRELGDVNCDGARTAEDITRLARHVAKISEEDDPYKLLLFNADRSTVGDTAAAKVDAADITHLARYVAKIIEEL